jgi:hypothetical protein
LDNEVLEFFAREVKAVCVQGPDVEADRTFPFADGGERSSPARYAGATPWPRGLASSDSSRGAWASWSNSPSDRPRAGLVRTSSAALDEDVIGVRCQ